MSVNNIKDAVASCPACEESAYSDPLSSLMRRFKLARICLQ